MNFINFIKDKIINIFLILFALSTIEILLMIYDLDTLIKIYIPFSIILVYFVGLIIEFCIKKSYYTDLENELNELDKKYLITEIINDAQFLEGKILKSILQDSNKSMLDNVNYYKHLQEEYKDYIELWIHEVKIPIATSKLIVENNKNETTKSINEELDKIEDYTEQALFYARSNNVEKDYIIRKINLQEIINNVINKNKNQLISLKIKVIIKEINLEVYTDSKWIIFILNQIIINSIKYSNKNNSEIIIFSKEMKDNVVLYIKDNGIGIKKGEIARVFEKGFTGSNGRINGKKSTGIGLFLCKKLCNKLQIGLELNSIENEGTEVKIIFPKNSHTNFLNNLKEEFYGKNTY